MQHSESKHEQRETSLTRIALILVVAAVVIFSLYSAKTTDKPQTRFEVRYPKSELEPIVSSDEPCSKEEARTAMLEYATIVLEYQTMVNPTWYYAQILSKYVTSDIHVNDTSDSSIYGEAGIYNGKEEFRNYIEKTTVAAYRTSLDAVADQYLGDGQVHIWWEDSERPANLTVPLQNGQWTMPLQREGGEFLGSWVYENGTCLMSTIQVKRYILSSGSTSAISLDDFDEDAHDNRAFESMKKFHRERKHALTSDDARLCAKKIEFALSQNVLSRNSVTDDLVIDYVKSDGSLHRVSGTKQIKRELLKPWSGLIPHTFGLLHGAKNSRLYESGDKLLIVTSNNHVLEGLSKECRVNHAYLGTKDGFHPEMKHELNNLDSCHALMTIG